MVRFEHTLLCFAKVDVPRDSPGVAAAVGCELADLDTYDLNTAEYVVHPGPYTLIAAQHSGELRAAAAVAHITIEGKRVNEG